MQAQKICKLLLASALLMVTHSSMAANAVSTPIADSDLELHLRPFARAFGANGRVLRLNTIVNQNNRLYVSAEEGQVFDITDGGISNVVFDFAATWRAATGRPMSFESRWHSGLRGIAFSPNFNRDQKIYTSAMEVRPNNPGNHHYLSDVSRPIVADSVVSEWTLVNGRLDPTRYRELFRVGMPVFDHPIKDLAFGPDNMLYVLHGDASVQSSVAGGGQRNDALGKVLRINPEPSGNRAYTVPADNPFVGNSNMLDEVWSLGHRNPHTITFADDGTLLLGEVGRDNIDEINVITRGGDYGWPQREGTFVHLERGGIVTGVSALPNNDANFGFTYPVAQFGHEGRRGAGFVGQALAGGSTVENGSPISGQFLFGEFATVGDIYHISLSDIQSAVTTGNPSQLTQVPLARASIMYDHDANPRTPALQRSSFNDVIDDAPTWTGDLTLRQVRNDMRFGKGANGEVYISSKRNGLIYLITSTVPGGPGGFVRNVAGQTIEIETGTVQGSAGIDNSHAGASGSGYVENLINVGSGVTGLRTFAESSGPVEFDIRYAAGFEGPSSDRTVGAYVNGQRQATLTFTRTGSWSTWSKLGATLDLQAGANTIEFRVANEDTGFVNLDYLTTSISTVPVLAGELFQIELGNPIGDAEINDSHEGFSGTGYIEQLLDVGSGVDGLTIHWPTTEAVTLNIRYAMGAFGPDGDRTVGVNVNGSRQAQATFSSTGSWTNWSTVSVPVTLRAGLNNIAFLVQSQDTGVVNLDYFTVSSGSERSGGTGGSGGDTGSLVNLALNGTASQSSTTAGGNANRAIDGNTSGVWAQRSVTHTANTNRPSWQLELESTSAIEQITLFNRTDCCVSRLSDYTVSILNDSGATVFTRSFSSSPAPSNSIDVGGVIGRTVRVQLNGSNPLSLAEVQVFGNGSTPVAAPVTNIALNGTASQSSTDVGGNASRAIDGNTSGVWGQRSVTHTVNTNRPSWQVELASTSAIEQIILFNRTDCCVTRLSNYTVSVLNDNGAAVFSRSFSSAPAPSNSIDVGGVIGRTVRVQLNGSNPLSLAEVQVMGSAR